MIGLQEFQDKGNPVRKMKVPVESRILKGRIENFSKARVALVSGKTKIQLKSGLVHLEVEFSRRQKRDK